MIPIWCFTRRCQNLGFGGPEKRMLYVAGVGTLLRMLTRGISGPGKIRFLSCPPQEARLIGTITSGCRGIRPRLV